MVMLLSLTADGALAQVMGFGVGAAVSDGAVVAEAAGVEGLVVLLLALRSRALTVYLYSVSGAKPVSVKIELPCQGLVKSTVTPSLA
jgi:hypothetical protein